MDGNINIEKKNKTRKRCPNGQHINKKTGLCVDNKKKVVVAEPIPAQMSVPEPIMETYVEPVPEPIMETYVEPDPEPIMETYVEPDPEPIMETYVEPPAQKAKKTRKRCPNGQHINKKTGECVDNKKKVVVIPEQVYVPTPEPIMETYNADVPEPIIETYNTPVTEPEEQLMEANNEVLPEPIAQKANKTRKRCPKGQRINKKTGECVPIPVKNITKKASPVIEKEPTIFPVEYKEVPAPIVEEQEIITKTKKTKQLPIPPTTIIDIETNKNPIAKKRERDAYYNPQQSTEFDFLYPTLDDPMFNVKIARHKEFFNTQYDGKIHDIKKQAMLLCDAEFELTPHQLFVKNFLSSQTPYNSLLLFHSLGTGKTCTSIGISEEMRSYMKQVGMKQRIMVIASPNVQGNFRQQLFDETKLVRINDGREEDALWNIESCVGNSLLKEINPTNMRGLKKEDIVRQINSIINNYYLFMGYGQLMNYVIKKVKVPPDQASKYSEKQIRDIETANIKRYFDNRLIIIDEVHNIRITDDNKDKKIGSMLMKIAKYSDNLHFVFLSATPMFNSYEEIIWLTNLMNLNDKRTTIETSEVFNNDGTFKEARQLDDGTMSESGDALLRRKLTGYVSYVRGENPYTFPYRIYPSVFDPEHSLQSISYPTLQMNSKPIETPLKYINVYINKTGEYQKNGYINMINNLRKKSMSYYTKTGDYREMPSFENMEAFGYSILSTPLELLNMIYPSPELDALMTKEPSTVINEETIDAEYDIIRSSVGKSGMSKVMKYKTTMSPLPIRDNFEYLPEVEQKYGRIFAPDKIETYSAKIHNICQAIKKSKGIVLVYSQYIDGGLLPIALALEEMGFGRYCSNELYNKPLMKKSVADPIDAFTMKTKRELALMEEEAGEGGAVVKKPFKQAKYIIISGDKSFSPSNTKDVKYSTNPANKEGEYVKVILISKAGSEGLDFKNIRQIHVIEPWYNMNRIEQIIGRGVRNLSHCSLPFEDRNVEIYLHSTIMDSDEEAADLYLYRLAELKAIQIGKVTRLLKENAVDCILNISQTNFSVDRLNRLAANQNIELHLSSGKTINYKIGDRPYTEICDYMPECEYKCSPSIEINNENLIQENYNTEYLKVNNAKLVSKIKGLFKEKVFYTRNELINTINIVKIYPPDQIYYALTTIINNKNEFLIDKYGRLGNLINKANYYLFQPIEITDENIGIFERSTPVEYKRKDVLLEVSDKIITEDELKKHKKNNINDNEKREDVLGEEPEVTYKTIINKLYENYNTVFGGIKPKIKTGEKNYYKHAYFVLDHLKVNYEIDEGLIQKYIVYHNLDLLMLEDKLILLRFLYADERPFYEIKYNEIVIIIEKYFAQRLLYEHTRTGIILNKDKGWKLFIKEVEDNKNAWVEAEPDDYNYFNKQIDKLDIPDEKINNIVGFVNMFKDKEMVFKIKDVSQSRNNIGARCGDSTTKGDVIKLLNKLLETNEYEDSTDIMHYGLCVVIEVLMRYFTEIGRNGLVYYITPEETAINDIARFSRA